MAWSRTAPVALVAAALMLASGACGASEPESPTPRIAFADGTAVSVRAADGKVTRVAALPVGWRAETLTWSGGGSELAWVATSSDFTKGRIYRAAASGGPVRQWDCALFCGLVAFLGTDLIGEGSISGPERYPSAGGEPQAFEPDGLPGEFNLFGSPIYRGLLTGTKKGDAVYFATGSSLEAPKQVLKVGRDQTATPVHDVGSASLPGNGTVSPDGTQLAYTLDKAETACPATDTVVVADLRSKQAKKMTPPSSAAAMFVAGLWFDAKGQLFVAYVPGPVACQPGLAEQPDTPTRATAATVYERTGTTWKATNRQAQSGAELGGGRRLELTGALTVGPSRIQQSPGGTLRLIENGKSQTIGRGVTTFAVAPD